MKRTARAAVAVLVALGASALVTTPAGAGDDGTWSALLERVPATPKYLKYLLLSDYARAEEDVEIDDDGDAREQLARLTIEGGMSPSDLVATVGRDEDALRDELGIPVTEIEREVTAGDPPDQMLVLEGDLDADEIDSTTADEEVWGDLRAERSFAGQDYYAWDGERLHPDRITPVRRIGRGGRLAVDPPVAVWTTTDAAMKASLRASAGDTRSIADDRDVMEVVDAVQEEGAHSMVLTSVAPSPGADTGGPEALIEPSVVAVGGTADDGTPGIVVVLRQDSAADAKENAERLRAIVEDGTSEVNRLPWSEQLTTDEITTDGALVIATFDAESPRLWLQSVLTRDSLLATEGSRQSGREAAD